MSTRIYIVIGKTADWVEPSAADVKAGILGSGLVWAGDAPAPDVSATFDVGETATGLQPGVRYTAALVWSDGTTDSNVYVLEFTTEKKTGVVSGSTFVLPAAQSYDEDHARMIEREEREAEEIMMIVATLVQRGALHA
jgi:hypothetical protein